MYQPETQSVDTNSKGCMPTWNKWKRPIIFGCFWTLLIAAVFFGIGQFTTKRETNEDINKHSVASQLRQDNIHNDVREHYVSGKNAPCNGPYCKKCGLHTYPKPDTYGDVCQPDDIKTQAGPPACYLCGNDCIIFTHLMEDQRIRCDSPDTGPPDIIDDQKCCILAKLGNMDDYCNGGKLKCESHGNHAPLCECPPGTTGSRCEDDLEANLTISCNCHDSPLCEKDLKPCDEVYFNETSHPACQQNYNASSSSYNCYCNNTEMADNLEPCSDIEIRTGKRTASSLATSPVKGHWCLLSVYLLILLNYS